MRCTFQRIAFCLFVVWLMNPILCNAQTSSQGDPALDVRTAVDARAAQDFTQKQIDYLQAVVDDLVKIGQGPIALTLCQDIASGSKRFTMSPENPGTMASVDTPWILAPATGANRLTAENHLNINSKVEGEWETYMGYAEDWHQRGDSAREDKYRSQMRDDIRFMAFTMAHEYKHMGQLVPQEKPSWEDEAYETGIRVMRDVINDEMQKIREIQQREVKQPGDPDKLNELIRDLKASKLAYQGKVDSMQSDAIAQKKVTPEKFSTSKKDMDELRNAADILIKSAQNQLDQLKTNDADSFEVGSNPEVKKDLVPRCNPSLWTCDGKGTCTYCGPDTV